MASVHIGRLLGPVGFSRTVAIKRLHPQFARDPEFVTMFLDEARLAARIRHPNVVSTLDVVATQGELFLVMEYIQGESLAQLVRISNDACKPIPHEIIRTIMSGVLHGLHAAHEAKSERGEPLGIVHRDVSPQNIIVGTDGIARLLDFGIAKAASRAHVTRDRHIKGKLSYMAPEQVQNTAIDRRVDVYAASVVTWELLTGKRLFFADSESETLARVLTSPVVPPSAESRSVSFKLDHVVLRGLKRSRDSRYGTAREMALALEASGRLATTSAVGEWVEQTAQLTLAARAADVAAVEQVDRISAGSPSSQSLPIARKLELVSEPTADGPTPSEVEVDEPPTERDRPSLNGIGPESSDPTLGTQATLKPDEPVSGVSSQREPSSWRRQSHESSGVSHWKKRRVTALIGVLATLTSVFLWHRWNRPPPQHPRQPTAAAVSESPRGKQERAPESRSQGTESQTEAAPDPSETKRNSTAAANVAPVSKPDGKPAIPQAAAAPRPSPRANDCNPPYTVDELGIRHYKRKCL
jgi:serine/threonine-protein kinase